MNYRTPLAHVKKLGSARSGTEHFIHQRVTAIFLIGLTSWALYFFATVMREHKDIISFFTNFHLVASLLFVNVFLYHGYLGLKIVIEDYVHCKCMLNVSLISLKFVCLTTSLSYLLCVIILEDNHSLIKYLQ